METTQTPPQKRNMLPLLLFLIIIGVAIALIAKPRVAAVGNSQSGAADLTTNSDSGDTALDDSSTTNGAWNTVCEKTWPIATSPTVPDQVAGEHICGNPNAKLVIVEYTDLECPYCKVFHPYLQQLVAESNGKIAWVLRHYPIDQLHSRARHEAEAAECAGEQQGEVGFWKYVDKVFSVTSSNNSLSPDLLPLIAVAQGLDKNAFMDCLGSGKYLQKIANLSALAEANGHEAVGTPNSRIVMNGKEVEEVKGAVDFATLKAKTDLWLKAE